MPNPINYESMDFEFWNAETDREAVLGVVALEHMNQPYNNERRIMARRYGSQHEGTALSSLGAHGYTSSEPYQFTTNYNSATLIRNTPAAVVETFVSWIASQDNPKPTFITSKGNWSDKRKAEKMRKLVEAGYKEKQGKFQNTYSMCQHGMRTAAAATGAVAVKVCVYPGENKVVHELHDTLDMFVDIGSQSYGELMTVGEGTWMDPDRLARMFPDFAKNIRALAMDPPRDMDIARAHFRVKKLTKFYEAWRVSVGDQKGRYVAGLEDGTCLANEEYDYPTPPFAFLTVEDRLWGPFGWPMTHRLYESNKRDNLILGSIDKSVMKSSRSITFANKEALDNEADLDQIEDNQIIGVRNMEQVPKYVTPAGFNEAQLSLANQHRDDVYSLSGIPESKAGSKAEPGVDSAIGQRNVAAFINKRFATVQRNYVDFVAIDIASLHIRAMREIYKRDKKFSRKWSDGKFFEDIDGDVLNLPDSKYTLSGEATSSMKDTPADRVSLAQDLFKTGAISAEQLETISQNFDTPDAIEENTIQKEWIEGQMYKWCYAPDKAIKEPKFYNAPLKYLNLESATFLVVDGLIQAMIDELEDDRIEFFMLFLGDLDALLKAKNAAMAPTVPGGLPGVVDPTLPGPTPNPVKVSATI